MVRRSPFSASAPQRIAAGMKVVLSDIEAEPLERTTRALREAGADVHPVATDVSS
jgi:hypothetical protein